MNSRRPVGSKRWQQVEEICWNALALPDEARGAMLDEACAGDAALRRDVESLLRGAPVMASFLETDACEMAAGLLMEESDQNLAGRRLGSYVIGEWIGSGGMGDVYRARDERLGRDVALKILPGVFADSDERGARFMAEARLLATLSHPNIAAIHGFEESDGRRALVLELVEGSTLADRLADGPILVDEALSIARQIAEGLEAAHDCGIVHRDLKPSNVIVRPDGTVKLLDFGLATAFGRTATPGGERVVAAMGTPAYASPEQLKGRPADRRADIWAFGALVYELLSGRRAFAGDTTSEVVSSVLNQTVDWSVLPASTPQAVHRLLVRCLERDARQRLRDIGEARIVLDSLSSADGNSVVAVALPRAGRARWGIAAMTVAAIAFAAGATWSIRREPAPGPAVARFTHHLPDGQSITLPASRHVVAVSPDGQHIVYATDEGLQLRSLSSLEARTIRGSESHGAVTTPVFSPDGDAIAFWTPVDRTIKRIPLDGGVAVSVAAADNPYGMSWYGDSLVFGQGSKGVMRVRADGGTPELLVGVADDEEAHGPQLLPGGDAVLFTLARGAGVDRWDTATIVVQSLASGRRTILLTGGSDARYVRTGHLVYARSDTVFGQGTVFAVGFDAARLQTTGSSLPVVDGVRTSSSRLSGAFQFDMSAGGTLVYIPGSPVGPEWGKQQLVLADRTGHVDPLPVTPSEYRAIRVSPDGARIALEMGVADDANIYVSDMTGAAPLERLTFGGRNHFPVWSADSRRIAYQSDRGGDRAIFSQSIDGARTPVRLTTPAAGESHAPESWSPDGHTLLFSITTASGTSLATLSTGGGRVAAFSDIRSAIPPNARFSPDGQWIAYARADRGAASSIYVEPFPPTGARYQLIVQGPPSVAHKPVWSSDGRELLYVPRLGGFEAVRVTARPTLGFGKAVPLVREFNPGAPTVRALYDITPDDRFVGLIPVGDSSPIYSAPTIHVVLNWLEELKRRVPAK